MNGKIETMAGKEQIHDQEIQKARTSIGLRTTTKERLNRNRAPGQCYDGFICQLVDLWERADGNGKS